MSEAFTTLKLKVPKSSREVVGGAVTVIVLTAFLLFFVWLAIYDLLNSVAFIPSILWLAVIAGLIFLLYQEMGPKQVLVEIVGAFAPKQFIWTSPRDHTRKEIHCGYQVFGHRISYWKIPADGITQVYWNTGQATHMAGRDMDDWSVVVWYEHNDPAKTLKRQSSKNPDQDLHIVGPTGKKERIAAFGHSFLELLQKSGISLFPGKDECSFTRSPASQEKI